MASSRLLLADTGPKHNRRACLGGGAGPSGGRQRIDVARGYLPLVEDLPWKEDYFNKTTLPGHENSEAAKAAREQDRREIRVRFDKS